MTTNHSPTFAAVIHVGCESLKGAVMGRGRDGSLPWRTVGHALL